MKKATRNPERTIGLALVLGAKRAGNGRREGKLNCGHTLVARNVWAGKLRWCPECHPPRPLPSQPEGENT